MRNASASLRFRQRRKEKEREASQTIAALEAQLQTCKEQREDLRLERDHFNGLLTQLDGTSNILGSSSASSKLAQELIPRPDSGIADLQLGGPNNLVHIPEQPYTSSHPSRQETERIQILEDKILELRGLHSFYKEERDYFRGIVMDIPEKQELTQSRPLSPPESMEI